MKFLLYFLTLFPSGSLFSQNATSMRQAWDALMADPQLKHASAGFELVERNGGKRVFGAHAETLLSPASTQKVLTAAAALELLGTDFRFRTGVSLNGAVEEGILKGNLVIAGAGDPTLGSSRYEKNGAKDFLSRVAAALKQKGVHTIQGDLVLYEPASGTAIPDGWIWQDIGNYYGAGAGGFIWRENQYEVLLSSGTTPGSEVQLLGTRPELYLDDIELQLKAGAAGSGDNAYIYFEPGREKLVIRGTIPPARSSFSISGAIPQPGLQFLSELSQALMKAGIEVTGRNTITGQPVKGGTLLLEKQSPPLPDIVQAFLQKSVNLFGEALLKELGMRAEAGERSTEEGIKVLEKFWTAQGVPALMLQLKDGSGLSPQNGITCMALNKVMVYAAARPWFPVFYKGLPVTNGFSLKSGTIGGVKCYAGYLEARNGKEYCFAIMVNRYNGNAAALNRKLFAFLEACR